LTNAEVAVCIATGGTAELRDRTLASVRAHTATEVLVIELESGVDALTATAPADVVLVQPGCLVADGWLEGLREAAHASRTTASATALTQHDLGGRPDGAAFDSAAATVRTRSLRLRPRLPAAGRADAACVYVRRTAIDLIADGEGFWERCLERGLSHVLADDVLVLDLNPAPARAAQDSGSAMSRAVGNARRALEGLSVTIDARILAGPTTGTHVHVLELISALARLRGLHLSALVPDAPSPDALARLQALPDVSLHTYEETSRARNARADIVHRPFQLSNAGELPFLASLGDRLVLTQQDLIAYHNPSYFQSPADWHAYRQLTRLALAAADRVVFFSAHARDDALGEELVAPAQASVVALGVDHPRSPDERATASTPPAGAEPLASGTRALLCLGTDFHHKNRVFALRVLATLRTTHNWDGVLVLAGPAVARGSSRPQEASLLASHPELAGAVLDVGAVTEAEKDWLLDHCALVLYPSVIEGFGLVPFEAAAHQTPCMWASGSSLSELLPDDAAEIVPWDVERTAERALALLTDRDARERNVQVISVAGSNLTWDATAARLLEVYEATAAAPAIAGPASARDTGDLLTTGLLSEDAARLVGPGGELPADVQRPLLALATHPRIAAPVFGALKFGYRISYEVRRRRHRRK
jgi:glycosyltransferase involved in cell wall biosynthesis